MASVVTDTLWNRSSLPFSTQAIKTMSCAVNFYVLYIFKNTVLFLSDPVPVSFPPAFVSGMKRSHLLTLQLYQDVSSKTQCVNTLHVVQFVTASILAFLYKLVAHYLHHLTITPAISLFLY